MTLSSSEESATRPSASLRPWLPSPRHVSNCGETPPAPEAHLRLAQTHYREVAFGDLEIVGEVATRAERSAPAFCRGARTPRW
jgi:hypothetical protein